MYLNEACKHDLKVHDTSYSCAGTSGTDFRCVCDLCIQTYLCFYFFQTNRATTKPHRNKNETLKPHLKKSAKNDTLKV